VIIPQREDKPSTAVRGRPVSNAATRPVSPATAPAWEGIARYWRFMAVVLAACVAATAAYVALVPPKWEASAHILLTTAPDDADLSGLGLVSGSVEPARSLQTAIALLDTPAAESATAAALGAPWDAASVGRSVVLEPLGQSYVVEVRAQADSPSAAARLATTYVESALAARNADIKQRASALIALRTGLPAAMRGTMSAAAKARLELIARTGDPSLSMAQPAVPPSSPVGLPAQYKIALSVVLGLGLAIAGAWVRACRARPDDGMRVPAHLPDDDGWDK
jgi:uncharacterized protein involved in exopolysaccharide biosynthesis